MTTVLRPDDVCVLMPVHAKTCPAHLRAALESLGAQTMPAGEILLIQDGLLTQEHEAVIERARELMEQLSVLTPGRVGLVEALNSGLAHTSAPWVARMDADDVADPERIRLQAEAACDGITGVIGSAMVEFRDTPGDGTARRSMPEEHDAIIRRLRRLNPLNHPTVLMRREDVVAAGGYLPLPGMEDYYLWARLAARGTRFRNLPQALVHYRVDQASYRRRADPAAIRAEWHLQQHLRHLGFVGWGVAGSNLVVRVLFRLLPPRMMRLGYGIVRKALAGGGNAS